MPFRRYRPHRLGFVKSIAFLLTTLAAVVVFLGVMLVFPNLWFRDSTVGFALPRVLKSLGYTFQGHQIHAHAKRINWQTAQFEISWKKADFSTLGSSSPSITGEVQDFGLQSSVQWLSLSPKILRIERLIAQIKGAIVQWDEAPAPASLPQKNIELPRLVGLNALPDFIKGLRVDELWVDAPEVHLVQNRQRGGADRDFAFRSLQLEVHKSGAPQALAVHIEDVAEHRGFVHVILPSTSDGLLEWSRAQGKVDLTLPQAKLIADVHEYRCDPSKTCLNGQVSWQPRDRTQIAGQVHFEAISFQDHLDFKVQAEVLHAQKWLPRLETQEACTIKLSSHSQTSLDSLMSCGFRGTLKLPLLTKVPGLKLPGSLNFTLASDAQIENQPQGVAYRGVMKLAAQPRLADLLHVQFLMKSNFQGLVSQGLNGLHQESDLSLQGQIQEAKRVIALLHDSPWAIPAPFNNLGGGIRFELNSHWRDWESEVPFELATSLKSTEQALRTRLKGRASMIILPRLSLDLAADWQLEEVRLSAPRLDPTQLPRVFSDSQIAPLNARPGQAAPPSAQKPWLTYRISISTQAAQPLLIDSNLFPNPVALDIHANLSHFDGLRGELVIRPLDFQVFKRSALLEKMSYRRLADEEQIDGTARVTSGNYQVFAHFFGKPDKIRVQLSSEPAISEDELWAILLFGEPMNSLDIDQQDSTHATEQALSKGALGLFSLYAFASTPIERVSYDPATQRVAVRFRVREGTSIELGRSDQTAAEIGLRKRLGKNWAFNATVGEAEDALLEKRTQAAAALEWTSRY